MAGVPGSNSHVLSAVPTASFSLNSNSSNGVALWPKERLGSSEPPALRSIWGPQHSWAGGWRRARTSLERHRGDTFCVSASVLIHVTPNPLRWELSFSQGSDGEPGLRAICTGARLSQSHPQTQSPGLTLNSRNVPGTTAQKSRMIPSAVMMRFLVPSPMSRKGLGSGSRTRR